MENNISGLKEGRAKSLLNAYARGVTDHVNGRTSSRPSADSYLKAIVRALRPEPLNAKDHFVLGLEIGIREGKAQQKCSDANSKIIEPLKATGEDVDLVRMREALEKIAATMDDGEYTAPRHFNCVGIARGALLPSYHPSNAMKGDVPKSPMVATAPYITDKENYSELQVMRSGAGWYVGTVYKGEYGDEPGSRDSDYFATKEEAEAHLKAFSDGEDVEMRLNP